MHSLQRRRFNAESRQIFKIWSNVKRDWLRHLSLTRSRRSSLVIKFITCPSLVTMNDVHVDLTYNIRLNHGRYAAKNIHIFSDMTYDCKNEIKRSRFHVGLNQNWCRNNSRACLHAKEADTRNLRAGRAHFKHITIVWPFPNLATKVDQSDANSCA